MRRRQVVLLALALTTACRDGAAPFTGDDRLPLTGSSRQLTFNPNDDRNPTWSSNSDTVYYTADFSFDSQKQPSALYKMELERGLATLVAPEAQSGVAQTLMLGVPSPKRDRVVFVHMGPNPTPAFCSPANGKCVGDQPLLEFGTLRVRSTSSHGLAGFDPGTTINFLGADSLRYYKAGGPYFERAFPYQMAFNTSGALLFRPTWSPDGQKVAFSDGLSINIWDTQDGSTPIVIPNTRDAVSPAWSPDGSRIAFTRLVRGDSVLTACQCKEDPLQTTPETYNRWTYTLARSEVTLINPDGSNPVVLTEGGEPAWSPDGGTIYFTRDDLIRRIPSAGGAPSDVPGTELGRSPSVSPDGKWLAFSRGTLRNGKAVDQNIWLVSLTGQ